MSGNDPCVCCGEDTAFGSSKFVNRIPGDHFNEETGEFRDGYWCADCLMLECSACDKPVPEDDEVWVTLPTGEQLVYHPNCVPEDERANIERECDCDRCTDETVNGAGHYVTLDDGTQWRVCQTCADQLAGNGLTASAS